MAPKKSDFNPKQIRADVRAYLDAWEAWENDNKKEAPISGSERNALTLLGKVSQQPFGQDLVDDTNYLSALNEWCQREGITPSSTESDVIDDATSEKRFRVTFELPRMGVFPRVGYGIIRGQEAPSFSQKKRAKQYAAKHALAWIENLANEKLYGASPSESRSRNVEEYVVVDVKEEPENDSGAIQIVDHPAPSANNSPIHKKPKVQDTEEDLAPPMSPLGWANILPRSPSSSNDGEPSTIRKRIGELTRELGFDAPTFKVKQDANGRYYGRPIFQLDGRMPENLGAVENMNTENQAKDEMARHVHFWLINQKLWIESAIDETRKKMAVAPQVVELEALGSQ